MDDEAKKKILARRAKFVAAALAGVSCGKEPAQPQPSVVYVGDAGTGTPSSVEPDDGQQHMWVTSTGTPPDPWHQPCTPTDAGCIPAPLPCLSPVAPTPQPNPNPQPCLKIKPAGP